MKKIISIFLSAALLLSLMCMLGGCETDAEKIIGTWTADINYAEALNAGFDSAEGMEDMAEYFHVDEFILTTSFTFNEDGTFTVALDKDSAKAALEKIKDDLRSGIEKYFEDLIKEMGVSMTVSDLLAASGMTLDSMMDSMFTDEMMDDLLSEVANEYTGKYQMGEGKIFMTDSTEDEISEEYYDTYELKGDTLTLLECHCEQTEGYEGIADALYPVVLTRAE